MMHKSRPKKAFLVDTLTSSLFEKLARREADMIFANHIKLKQGGKIDRPAIHDAFIDPYRQVSWMVFKRVEQMLDALARRNPQLLQLEGVDIRSALLKYLFWVYCPGEFSLEAAYSLFQARSQEKVSARRWGYNPLVDAFGYSVRASAQVLRALRPAQQPVSPQEGLSEGKIAYVFLVDSPFALALMRRLILQFDPSQTAIALLSAEEERVFLESADFQLVAEKGYTFTRLSYPPQRHAASERLYPRRSWFSQPKLVYHILRFRDEAAAFRASVFPILSQGPRAIITCAAENLWEGHLLCEYGKMKGIKIINVMNGLKDGGADSAKAAFDLWFVWDQRIADTLVEHVQVPPEMLSTEGGHLAEDAIREHQYAGSLDAYQDKLVGRQVILFTSIPGSSASKLGALSCVYALMEERPEVVMIYRPHPREQAGDYYLPESEHCRQRVHVISDHTHHPKESLYDQFLFSDLVLCIGSTVGAEAFWADVPCITYEEKETSVLYCVDGKRLIHAQDQASLRHKINELLSASLMSRKPRQQLGRPLPEAEKISSAELYAKRIFALLHSEIRD